MNKYLDTAEEIIECCKSHYDKCNDKNKKILKQCYKELYQYSSIT
jgi:hypothetical protein